jgi:hypothetical protein
MTYMGTVEVASRLPIAVLLCVAVVAMAISLVGVLTFVSWRKGGGWGVRGESERAYQELRHAIQGLQHKYAALDAYSNAYFNTFHASGWHDLKALIDDLELAESSLLLLMERRRFEEVRDVSLFLLGRASPDLAQELMNRFEGLENIADWRRRSREILLRVIQASMDSARKIASVGISRNRSKKPTLVTLAELRSSISD